MARFAGLAAAGLMLSLAGCEKAYFSIPVELRGPPILPTLLVCQGDFGQFANGFMVSRPMQLSFGVNWSARSVTPLNGGSASSVIKLDSAELSFEVQYEGYRVAYHLNRVDGTFSQRPDLGGIFFGQCQEKPYTPAL
jgi:hypothetical protein